MSKPPLLLIGAGGHAHACIDVIEQHGKYQIAGLVGMQEEMNTQHLGYMVIATDSDLPELTKTCPYALITVGHIRSAGNRIRLYHRANEIGLQMPSIIAPTAYISSHATIGAGTIVLHGAIVSAGAKVGNNCIINTRALIEHGATVADHCHISTGVILNGDVQIGAGSFVGSGSIIKEGVTLGADCMIGMGSSVRHNLGDHTRHVGQLKT